MSLMTFSLLSLSLVGVIMVIEGVLNFIRDDEQVSLQDELDKPYTKDTRKKTVTKRVRKTKKI